MKEEPAFLEKIVAVKRQELAAKKQKKPYAQLEQELLSVKPFDGPGFYEALKSTQHTQKIIAEVKKASPSRGIIRNNFSLAEINDAYQTSPNVVAISVLTEKDHFEGGDDVLAFFAAHNAQNKPLLRKDFIFDAYQVLESKLLGAQAYLLIAALLDDKNLDELVDLGLAIGIEPLVEVHDERELEAVKKTKARVIGVNSRDLKTFTIEPKTHELLRGLDDSYAKIAESGIDNPEYFDYLSSFSDAALIGTEFMKTEKIKSAIENLVKLKEPAK